jgi:hypothetical protein
MREQLCFVQFIHPGLEHRPDRDGAIGWNTSGHKRKFMVAQGRAVRGREERKVDLAFWGEWEPPSDLEQEILDPVPHGPRWAWRPWYTAPERFPLPENTDPLVFGGFFYSICRQNTKRGPNQLRYLARGSVLLFGSHQAGSFVLDTVFVVERGEDYSPGGLPADRAPRLVHEVVMQPLAWAEGASGSESPGGCAPPIKASFRFYNGATYDSPLDGMFSFFPCLPWGPGSRGFARPAIRLPGIINPAAKQAGPHNPQEDISAVRKRWESVREQVIGQGLWLGVYAEPPPRR